MPKSKNKLQQNSSYKRYVNIECMEWMKKIEKVYDNKHIACVNCEESHCCKNKIKIDILELEIPILLNLITSDHIEAAKEANAQLAITGSFTCPFLINGRCSIYEDRPFTCAQYMVLGKPDNCIDPKGEIQILQPTTIYMKLARKFRQKDLKSHNILDLFNE